MDSTDKLPTRAEIAAHLHEEVLRGWALPLQEGSRWFLAADYVLDLLARRPATDEAEALVDKAHSLCAEVDQLNRYVDRIRDLESQLAARPEPVVIDEALSRRVEEAYWAHSRDGAPDDMMRALRIGFGGDRASVTVPRGDAVDENGKGWRYWKGLCNSFEDMRHEAADERDQLRAELERLRVLIAKTDPCDEVRAELAKTRGELEACVRHRDLFRKHQLRAEAAHDALRAGAQKLLDWAEHHRHRNPPMGTRQHGYVDAAAQVYGQLSALLKPAPAEAEPASGICQSCGSVNTHSTACETQHPPPESAMVEPLAARVERLELGLTSIMVSHRSFLLHWARGSFNKHQAQQALEALDARKGAP